MPIKSYYVHRKLNHLFNQSYLAHFPLDDFNIYDSYIVFGLISTRFLQVLHSVVTLPNKNNKNSSIVQ